MQTQSGFVMQCPANQKVARKLDTGNLVWSLKVVRQPHHRHSSLISKDYRQVNKTKEIIFENFVWYILIVKKLKIVNLLRKIIIENLVWYI